MKKLAKLLGCTALLIALAGFALGGAPVGTITSSGTFDLHGTAVRTEGIPFWPLMAGDEIATHAFSALVRFQDGSSVVLGENSRAKIETVNDVLTFRLTGGTMQVTAGPIPTVKIYKGAELVALGSGIHTVGGGDIRGASPRLKIALPPPPNPVSGK
jgi:hypothetical protein